MKRIAAALGALSVVMLALPAHAAPAATARLTSQRGGTVEGVVTLSATGSAPTGVQKVEILVDDYVVAREQPSGVVQDKSVGYSWNTNLSTGSGQLAPNGTYTVKVHTVANGGAEDWDTVQFTSDNPAQTPTGVATSVSGRNVAVSWDKNPEPDITGYQVERDAGSGFVVVGNVSGTVFTETVDPGNYAYRVVAIRNSPARSAGRPSAPSQAAGVNIAPPPSTSGGGSGGSSGGAGGGSGGTKDPLSQASNHIKSKGGQTYFGGKAFAVKGLGAGAALPPGFLPPPPQTPETPWGSYEKDLPYNLPKGGVPAQASRIDNVAARAADWKVLPPDGMRWVAAGALAIVMAALLKLLSLRLAIKEKAEAIALPVPTENSNEEESERAA